ncbi:3635_t:CDS:2, partial [Gigaspora rosea]
YEGEAPYWFSNIEKVTLKSSDSRKFKEEYQLEGQRLGDC